MDKNKFIDFVTPFYVEKDIMHDMHHIELVIKYVDKVIKWGNYNVDYDKLIIAAYLHGFIYSHEELIKNRLSEQGFPVADIDFIVKIAWESQRSEMPKTLEGKILHEINFSLCYNTVYPFCCWTINSILNTMIDKKLDIKPVLDWVLYQLGIDDINFK